MSTYLQAPSGKGPSTHYRCMGRTHPTASMALESLIGVWHAHPRTPTLTELEKNTFPKHCTYYVVCGHVASNCQSNRISRETHQRSALSLTTTPGTRAHPHPGQKLRNQRRVTFHQGTYSIWIDNCRCITDYTQLANANARSQALRWLCGAFIHSVPAIPASLALRLMVDDRRSPLSRLDDRGLRS